MTRGRRAPFALWSIAALLAPSLAAAQTLGRAGDFEFPVLRLALGLLACAFIALIAALALRRFMRGSGKFGKGAGFGFLAPSARKIRVIESHRLGTSSDVCVFICDGRQYLVVVSAAGATLLRGEPAATPAEGAPAS